MPFRIAAVLAVVTALVLVPAATAAPTISTSSVPGATQSAVYPSTTLTATGGTAPYTWAVTAGSLPAGLTLSASGVITGTPTGTADATFTVQVTDAVPETATKQFTIVVHGPPTVSSTTLGGVTVGTAITKTLSATGGTTPYAWSLASGTLPAGLTLASGTGVLSGTPTTAGTYAFGVKVTDTNSAVSATVSLTLAVVEKVAVSSTTVPPATTGAAYTTTLTATGGLVPLTWSVGSGSLPAGVTMSSGGVVSGTPSAPGSFTFEAKVADATGGSATKSFSLSVANSVAIATGSLPASTVGSPFSAALSVTGGNGPFAWVLSSGALPAGIALSTSGQLSGTPTAAGTAQFTVKVTDAAGATTTRPLELRVASPLKLASAKQMTFKQRKRGSKRIVIAGGSQPLTMSRTAGRMPAGLQLSRTGVLSGRPLAKGSWRITVFVQDAAGATLRLQIRIVVKK